VSSDWIVVVVITGLLVMMTAYLVFLAFRSRRDEKADGRADDSPDARAKAEPVTGRKAA
jgi:phosphotransferase system  glucose/maltose/N-acetylglucosamine-specific IIC component